MSEKTELAKKLTDLLESVQPLHEEICEMEEGDESPESTLKKILFEARGVLIAMLILDHMSEIFNGIDEKWSVVLSKFCTVDYIQPMEEKTHVLYLDFAGIVDSRTCRALEAREAMYFFQALATKLNTSLATQEIPACVYIGINDSIEG